MSQKHPEPGFRDKARVSKKLSAPMLAAPGRTMIGNVGLSHSTTVSMIFLWVDRLLLLPNSAVALMV